MVKAIGLGALPKKHAVSVVRAPLVDLKQIIGRAHLTADRNAITWHWSPRRNRPPGAPYRSNHRSITSLDAHACFGEPPLAHDKDQVGLVAARNHHVALPVVKSLVQVADRLAILRNEPRVKLLAIHRFHPYELCHVERRGRFLGLFCLSLHRGERRHQHQNQWDDFL
jgi:hypothetical protein